MLNTCFVTQLVHKRYLGLSSGTTIDRQLPVSLFDATKSNTTGVFTGGKSAIDFWAVDGDTINVYELKSDNPMVGIITEIFSTAIMYMMYLLAKVWIMAREALRLKMERTVVMIKLKEIKENK